jgi:hypothetical protein
VGGTGRPTPRPALTDDTQAVCGLRLLDTSPSNIRDTDCRLQLSLLVGKRPSEPVKSMPRALPVTPTAAMAKYVIKEGLVDQLFISGERRFVRLAFFL